MPRRGKSKHTNEVSNSPGLESDKSNPAQVDNHLVATTENQELNHRVNIHEELVNNQLTMENIQIKELQDKLEKLEEQVKQYGTQIKYLEAKVKNLEYHNSKKSDMESVVSTDIKGNVTNQSDVIIHHKEENNPMVLLPITNLISDNTTELKPEKITTCKTDLISEKQERSTNVQPESEDVHVEQLQSLNPENNNRVNNSQLTQNSNKKNHEIIHGHKNKSETCINNNSDTTSRSGASDNRHPVRRDNSAFTSWMNSSDGDLSLWSNKNFRNPLLSYIGKIYGQRGIIRRLLEPLKLGLAKSNELDQLYNVIQQFEKQPGAKESLREWRLRTRSNHRLDELRAIFEFKHACPSQFGDLKILPMSNLEEIISRKSINAYFDLICRDGLTTADIGQYLQLDKENIFGGNDYDSHNERVTFVHIDLNQSIINLADDHVDLVTCFVTLHHVPDLKAILFEIVRILRPGGYLILREHDCENVRSLQAKYLNFVHAFMMIARVGEFAHASTNPFNKKEDESDDDSDSETSAWKQQKDNIITHTSSIQYRTRDEWRQALESVGFLQKATLDYDPNMPNPQALYYAAYQLRN